MSELKQTLINMLEQKNNKITPENLKVGVEIFGVEGTFTADADATAADIVKDKIAYVNGEKIVGTMSSSVGNAVISTTLPAGNSNGTQIALKGFIELIGDFIAPTDSSYLFFNCTKLQRIGSLDTSSTTKMSNMFYGCKSLLEVPPLNTNKTTNTSRMFYNCSSLQEMPSLITSKVTNANAMFYGCSSLKEAIYLDIALSTDTGSMFNGCTNLETVPAYNLSSCTEMSGMFNNCSSLSNESLNNILQMCISAVKASSAERTLKNIGLTSDQATICTTLSNYQAFLDAGWTTGY